MKELRCLRCDRPMDFLMREKIQLGEASPWLGQRSNVIAGALEADFYVCPGCGKLELFHAAGIRPEEPEEGPAEELLSPLSAKCPDCEAIVGLYSVICPECGKTGPFIPQIKCQTCGSLHDFDDLQCPYCGKKE